MVVLEVVYVFLFQTESMLKFHLTEVISAWIRLFHLYWNFLN